MSGMYDVLPTRWSGLLNRFFPELEAWTPSGGLPALNVWQDDDALHVEAELPGMKIEDLELTVTGRELRIAGERKMEEREGVSCHRRERAAGKFARTLELPVAVNSDKVQATLSNGVLQVTLPKAEEAKARRIDVKVK